MECPGIDINLGFIGYRDVGESYVNINFTQDYYRLQLNIQNLQASGGMGDGPEDVAWAMEAALKKDWKSNAKFAIFIADAPCHGKKYNKLSPKDLYPNGAPGRRNIEDIMKDFARRDISLYCMEITVYTQEMFEMFEDTYMNYSNADFRIIPMNSAEELSDTVIDSAATVYVSQRNRKR